MSRVPKSCLRGRFPRLGETLAGIGIILALIGIWELVCRLGLVSDLILPAPTALARELWAACGEIVLGGPMRVHVLVTLYEILAGFALACAIGFGLGVLIAEIPVLSRSLMPYLIALNAAPKIALAPMLVIWFGFGTSSKIVMAALIAFFPLLVNVVAGIAAADPAKLRLMRSLAASRVMIFTKVKLPDALPMIFAGLKTAIVLAVVGAVVGEFVGADAGLGHVIKRSEYQLDVPLTFAVIVLLSVIGIVLFYAIELLERRILFWAAPRV
jgi:NitT/TauT family transport system permease protein